MKNKRVWPAFAGIALFNLFANLVHPVTPAYLQMRGVHDYMFGVAYACMAAATFLFFPFWGRIADRAGRTKVIFVCLTIYAFAQFLFSSGQTETAIAAARLIGGAGAGGATAVTLTYLNDSCREEERTHYLMLSGAAASVISSFGYLAGGVLGEKIGIINTFRADYILLFALGVYYLFLPEYKETGRINLREAAEAADPRRIIQNGKMFLQGGLLFFFASVFLTNLANTCFDQSYNYYLREALGFPTSWNGYVKAAIGILGLLSNSLIGIRIASGKKPVRGYLMTVLAVAACNTAVLFMRGLAPFLAASLAYYAFFALELPLQQTLLSRRKDSGGELFGLFQSARSLGWIIGSLTAGFLYEAGRTLPFCAAAVFAFLAAAVITKLKTE